MPVHFLADCSASAAGDPKLTNLCAAVSGLRQARQNFWSTEICDAETPSWTYCHVLQSAQTSFASPGCLLSLQHWQIGLDKEILVQ
jgi:hypothetical protein